ncbi:MAG: hypothetical protein ACRDWI_03040 [Jiangellaceae bacterium]
MAVDHALTGDQSLGRDGVRRRQPDEERPQRPSRDDEHPADDERPPANRPAGAAVGQDAEAEADGSRRSEQDQDRDDEHLQVRTHVDDDGLALTEQALRKPHAGSLSP